MKKQPHLLGMNTKIFILCLALALFAVQKTDAETISDTCGDNVSWSLDTETGLLTITGTGPMSNYTFSSRAPWYSYRASIQTIAISSGVTSIGGYAFNEMDVTSITVPNTLTIIGDGAFNDCRQLADITLPSSVTSIGNSAFSNCTSLTSINIPDGLTYIGEYAFSGCEYIESAITIPNGVSSIGKAAFSHCRNLPSITINSRVPSISEMMCYNCQSLTSINIPTSVITIGESAFWGCRSIASITIPSSVTTIKSQAFSGCTSLGTITIPATVTSIWNDAFDQVPFGLVYYPKNYDYWSSPWRKSVFVQLGKSSWVAYDSHVSVSVSCDANGSAVLSSESIEQGSQVTLTITPNEGYDIAQVLMNNVNITDEVTDGCVTKAIHEETQFVVTFQQFLPVSVSCGDNGSAELSATTVGQGDEVTLTITPNEDYVIDQVLMNDEDITADVVDGSVTKAISEGTAFTVTFKKTHTVSVSCGENGSAELSATTVDDGSDVTLTITPDDGYAIDQVLMNDEDITADVVDGSVTKTISEETTFTVTFKKTHTVSVSCGENGSAELSATTVDDGSNVTLTISPNDGYYLYQVLMNGVNITAEVVNGCVTKIIRLNTVFDVQFRPEYNSSYTFNKDNGLPGTRVGESIVYESPLFTSETPLTFMRMAVLETVENRGFGTDEKYFNINEFYLYDADGNRIELTAQNFSSNAKEQSEGSYEALCDGSLSTFFHSSWTSAVGQVHYLDVSFPQPLSAFSFAYEVEFGHSRQINAPTCISIMSDGELVTTPIEKQEEDENQYYTYTCTYDVETDISVPLFSDSKDPVGMSIDGIEVTPSASYRFTTSGEHVVTICDRVGSRYLGNGCMKFSDCHYLTSITIPEGVECIEERMFYRCDRLNSITIPNSVKKVVDYAFDGCSSLTSITIPNSVISIGAYAFSACNSLTSVTIPNSVTSIGNFAFSGCSGLTSITIPNSVTSIGSCAFNGCSGLTSVTIPNSVISIGSCAFQNCTGLTSVTIPNSVTSIGSYAFNGCSGLTSVTIPNSVTSIGEGAFDGCSGLTSVTIPNSVTSIGSWAFQNCTGLTSVTIPNSVTSIGSYAFNGCSGLTSITIPNSVTSIGYYAFSGCSGLTSITIPNSVTSIGSYAFQNCTGLTSVTIPNSVTSIESYAFNGCNNLTELRLTDIGSWVTNVSNYSSSPLTGNSLPKHLFLNDEEIFDLVIPDGVTSIPANAFTSCNFIKAITFPESLVSIADGTGIETNQIERIVLNSNIPPALTSAAAISYKCMILVPAEALNDYRAADYWKNHVTQIIDSKENMQFDYDVHVTANATLSALHMTIGEENLAYVQSLKVTGSINSYDIMIINNKMTNLRHLDISDASIVANAYEYRSGYCTKDDKLDRYSIPKQLYSLKLPKDLKALGDYALEGCSQLSETELALPDGLLSVGANVFSGSIWTTIAVPESVTSIATYAFSGCNTLRVLTMPFAPYTLYELGVNNNLVELAVTGGTIIPSNFTRTASYMGYSNLQKVTLGETITEIGSNAFSYCNLTVFRINHNMTIDVGALGDRHLSNLYIPHDCNAQIDRDAFYRVDNVYVDDLETLYSILWKGIGSTCFDKTTDGSVNFYVNGELVEDMVIPEGVTELNDPIFRNGTFKTLALPSTLRTIGKEVFKGCKNLQSVVFPSNLESINASAFQGCTALQAVSLPTTLKTIGDNAFQGCTAMTEVRLSPSITKIGAQAFNGCTALNDVYTYTIEPQSIDETTFSTYDTATLHCPAVSYYNYYYDTQWSKFLHLVNFDEPYEYVYIAKDFDIYTETAGVISGKPRMDIAAGGGVTVTGNREQELGDVHIMANANSVASLIGNDNLTAENLYLDITVKADYWHFFCFPFDVDLTRVQKEGSYIFRRYDGVLRAQNGGGGWQDIEGTTLHAGEGYIFRTNTAGLLSLPIVAPDLSAKDVATSLEEYASENTADKSWNFIGNPYLAYYDINDIDYTAPIVIWDGTAYTAYRPGDDEYVLQPFQPFFLQRPANVESAGFDTEGRTTYLKSQNAVSSANARRAKAQRLNPDRLLINLTLTDGTTTDKARVVFNDKQSLAYEMECDAAKFISTEQVPLLYSLDGEGTKYAINERPAAEGTVQLGFTAPRTGTYTIATTRMDTPVYIEDKVTGEVHFLNDGDFTFHAEEGTDNSRFVLALAVGDITGIENCEEDADAKAPAYDLQGRKVTTPVQGGVYIVNGKKVLFE